MNYEESLIAFANEAYDQGLLKTYLMLSSAQKQYIRKVAMNKSKRLLETEIVDMYATAKLEDYRNWVENYYEEDNR